MDDLDLKLSRKMRRILNRLEKIVTHEIGEQMGIGLVIFPWTRPGEPSRVAEFQYISNGPREHMHVALKNLVKKWDAGAPSIPPHEKN